MKLYFKNAIPTILMFGILCLCLTGCQKEDAPVKEEAIVSPETQVLPTVNTIYGQQVNGKTFTSLKNQYGLNSLLSNSTESSSELSKTSTTNKEIIIHDDVIKEITIGGYTSYTMRLTLANANPSSIYNLTVEDNNGETGMFVTIYTPSQNSPMGKSVSSNEMSISTQRITNIDTYNPNEDNVTENGLGGTGGSGGGSSSQTYPYGCDGDIITTSVIKETYCGCGHSYSDLLYNICTGCKTNTPSFPSIGSVTLYECVPYGYGSEDNPDRDDLNYGGGGTSGSSGSPSYTTPIGVDGARVAENFVIAELNIVETKTINWIFDVNNALKVFSIYNFLRSDNSREAKNFAKAAIKALMDGVEDDKVCINSFVFTDVGSNWQNAGLSNVNVQFLTIGRVIALQNINFFQLHFGLPKLQSNGNYITNHNARYIAQDIMTQAEQLTNAYQSINPTATAIQLKTYFLEKMQEISAKNGGTVSTSAPIGWTGTLKPHQSYIISSSVECD